MLASRLCPPLLVTHVPPVCFRAVSWVGGNGFFGARDASGPRQSCSGTKVTQQTKRRGGLSHSSETLNEPFRSLTMMIAHECLACVRGSPAHHEMVLTLEQVVLRPLLRCAKPQNHSYQRICGLEPAGKGAADDRHPSELPSPGRICRRRRRDRFGAVGRSLSGRVPAARP